MKKTLLIFSLAIVLIGGGAFYGGIKYEQSKLPAGFSQRLAQMNGSVPQANVTGGFRNGAAGVNFVSGEILSQDDKSITIKSQDGGSKIIFLSETTTIDAFTSGSLADLETGKSVTVNGTANQDGSLTATSIQIRSAGMNIPSR